MSGRRRACPEQTVCVWCDQEPAPTLALCALSPPAASSRSWAKCAPSSRPSQLERVLRCEHPSILCPGPRPRRSKAGQRPECKAGRGSRASSSDCSACLWSVGQQTLLPSGWGEGTMWEPGGLGLCCCCCFFFFQGLGGQGKSLILKPQAWVGLPLQVQEAEPGRSPRSGLLGKRFL